eukprot:TRINITY_DN7696_c0_g1_i1.p1 TRINITY_DN7696_c0_g1~~TRINITY_DN7696_c0_g1_i1.p1  ORF type:complete len:506 (-),score=126.04 TRINITY_DN7696_c0_g1_i1:120-1637(-)
MQLAYYCAHLVHVIYLASDQTPDAQIPRLAEIPDILVATPGRLVKHLQDKNLSLDDLKMMVIDEADLTLSYGYLGDLETIKNSLPKICQGFLISATLSPGVENLKHLILHTPMVIQMEETQVDDQLLEQHTIHCDEKDKFLITYVMIQLKLLKGKTIVFVNNIDRCFKLKLFLERFSIKSAVLNSELPENSRYHIVEEFNRGLFDILIATDEDKLDEDEELSDVEEAAIEVKQDKGRTYKDEESSSEEEVRPSKTEKKKRHEYGVSRGIDFRDIANVINFDFPWTVKNYVHRVGRTARAGNYGTALSFITTTDEQLLEKIKIHQEKRGKSIEPFKFRMEVANVFRYRVEDTLRSVTRKQVKNAKNEELRREILNSQKLKMHFEENPQDLDALRHDDHLQTHKIKPQLKNIPGYLLPKKSDLQNTLTHENAPTNEDPDSKYRVVYSVRQFRRQLDPLKNFNRGRKRQHQEVSGGGISKKYQTKQKSKRRRKKKEKNIRKIDGRKFR